MFLKKSEVSLVSLLLIVSISFLHLLSLSKYAEAGSGKKTNEQLSEDLNSNDMSTRTGALAHINRNIKTSPLNAEEIEQILRLAEREEQSHESQSVSGELGQDYLIELIEALGNMNNARAVPYLINYLSTGTAAARGLNKIGEPSVDPLVKRLHDETVGFRSEAANALGLFLKPNERGYVAKGATREKIKKELIKEINDPRNNDPEKSIAYYQHRSRERAYVRINIIRTLGDLAESGDKEVVPIIKKIAEQDSYAEDFSNNKGHMGAEKKYKVKEEAQMILDKLKGQPGGR